MKKKTAKRTTTRKSTRRTTGRTTEHLLLLPFSFRRIILVTTAIALFVGVVVLFNKNQLTQSVAGISITKGLFAQARVDLPKIEGAASYNIYYKKQSASDYTNVARDIPASTVSYTVSYLKKGEEYIYKVAVVDGTGAEVWWSEEQPLTHIEPM
jgi:hypothetical protein